MKSNACPNKKNFFKITSKQLVIGALFAAMTIALKPIDFYFLPTARLNITAVPIILSGITLGPVLGAIVGFIADVLGYVLFDKSGQPLSLLLTLSSVMMGLVPGLIYRFTKKETKSRVKYTLLNGLSFLFLIAMLAVFLSAEGSIKIADGAILALHPISGQWVTLKTWVFLPFQARFLHTAPF
jgi:ECF transporter S component (folate family)